MKVTNIEHGTRNKEHGTKNNKQTLTFIRAGSGWYIRLRCIVLWPRHRLRSVIKHRMIKFL